MKKLSFFFFACFTSLIVSAHTQADTYIKEAQGFLANKQYKEAQLSLQDAINEINMLMAAQVADLMPSEINGLTAGDAQSSSAMGMFGGGVTITKNYTNASDNNNSADITIVANSPLMSTMGMYMSNPTMMGPGYKSVRIGTQRAIMKSETDGDVRSTEVQIPLTTTLITIQLDGFASEAAEMDFLNKLGIDKVKEALGE